MTQCMQNLKIRCLSCRIRWYPAFHVLGVASSKILFLALISISIMILVGSVHVLEEEIDMNTQQVTSSIYILFSIFLVPDVSNHMEAWGAQHYVCARETASVHAVFMVVLTH